MSKDMARKIQQLLAYWIDEQYSAEEPDGNTRSQKRGIQELSLKLRNYRPGEPGPERKISGNKEKGADFASRKVQSGNKDNDSSAQKEHIPTDPAAGTHSRTHECTEFKKISFMTDLKVFYGEDGMATKQHLENPFSRGLRSWQEQGVFETVPLSSIPKGSNIMSSHVVHRWKHRCTPWEFLKACIVPHGNRIVVENFYGWARSQ